MKTSTGILSFEIYNQEGKNQLYLSDDKNYNQLLKLKIRNSSPYHQIVFETAKTPHLTLKFKKGLLPDGFSDKNLKIKKYRLIKGSDLFSKSSMESFLFDKKKMEEEQNFQMDIQKILDAIDENQATRSINPEEGVFGFQGLLTQFNQLKQQDQNSEDFKWIGQIEKLHEDYEATLKELRKITTSNAIVKSNPLFTDIIQQVTSVFQKLGDLQQNTLKVERSIELLAKKVKDQQKTDLKTLQKNFEDNYKASTTHFVNAIKTNLKGILVEALHGIKIKDITNLEQLHINEDIIKKLENKVFIADDVQNSDWQIVIPSLAEADEEQSIQMTCKKAITLHPNEYLLVDFDLIGALKGSATTVVTELIYNQLTFQKNGKIDPSVTSKISQTVLNLVNFGALGIPPNIEAQVGKGFNILNNGSYENEVVLNLVNTQNAPIRFNENTKISLSFQKQQEGEINAAALMDKDGSLSNVSLLYKVNDLNTLVKALDNNTLINLLKPHLELGEANTKALLPKISQSKLLQNINLTNIIAKDGAKSQALNDDPFVKMIFDMLNGSNSNSFRLDKNCFFFARKYIAPNTFRNVNFFQLEYTSGISFFYNICYLRAFEYDTTNHKITTPIPTNDIRRQIKITAHLNAQHQLYFSFHPTKWIKRPYDLQYLDQSLTSQSLTVTSGIDIPTLLKTTYFAASPYFKGLNQYTGKFKDYDYLFYKQYEVNPKPDSKKSIIFADPIIIKKSADGTFQVLRPLPNTTNQARDLETEAFDSTTKITDAIKNTPIIDETLEQLCTITIQDTTVSVHYSIKALEESIYVYKCVFNKKRFYTKLNPTINGYKEAYYLKSVNPDSTTTFNHVMAIAKEADNLYRLDYISNISVNGTTASIAPNAVVETAYKVTLTEKVVNSQNCIDRIFSNFSKHLNLYGNSIYEPDLSKLFSKPLSNELTELIPNYSTVVKNNLSQIFQNKSYNDIITGLNAQSAVSQIKQADILTALNVSSPDEKNIEYTLQLESSATQEATYSTVSNLLSIPANGQYQLKINGLKTQLPTGNSALKVSILNVPDYKDAHLTTTVRRVSFLNEDNKGIFTTGQDNNNLTIIQDRVEVKSENFAIHDNVYKVMPIGSIIMWYGSVETIPGGWLMCDGKYGTPDLRDRFVVGAGNNYKIDDKGGQKEVTLSVSQIPSHTHTLNDYTLNNWDTVKVNGALGGTKVLHAGDNYDYTHNKDTGTIGGGNAHENRPPYYAIYYIMRTQKVFKRLSLGSRLSIGQAIVAGDYQLIVTENNGLSVLKNDERVWSTGSALKYIVISNGNITGWDDQNRINWSLMDESPYKKNEKASQIIWEDIGFKLADKNDNILYTIWQDVERDKVYPHFRVGQKIYAEQRVENDNIFFEVRPDEVRIRLKKSPGEFILFDIKSLNNFQGRINYCAFENGDLVIKDYCENTLWSLSNHSSYQPNSNAHEVTTNFGNVVIQDIDGNQLFTIWKLSIPIFEKEITNSASQQVANLQFTFEQGQFKLTKNQIELWKNSEHPSNATILKFAESSDNCTVGDLILCTLVNNGWGSSQTTIWKLSENSSYQPNSQARSLAMNNTQLFITNQSGIPIYTIWEAPKLNLTQEQFNTAKVLAVGEKMNKGDSSTSGKYKLSFENDSSFVLHENGSIIKTFVKNPEGTTITFYEHGRFSMLNASNYDIWSLDQRDYEPYPNVHALIWHNNSLVFINAEQQIIGTLWEKQPSN